ncbi:MAG: hypothetical protein LBI11_05955 [Streptococcaceae bacterium]|nr:hypothetical protein [Streptococcaceae bacterium]
MENTTRQTLYLVAFILNWVVLGLAALTIWGIITAAWIIPMNLLIWKIYKDKSDKYNHVALGICTLLFINLVSGILILVADGESKPE